MRRLRGSRGWLAALALGALSCQGSGSESGATSTELAGVWDAIGTSVGTNAVVATVIIDPTRFSIQTKSGGVTALAEGDGFRVDYWTDAWDNAHSAFFVERAGTPDFSVVALPLNIAGQWLASDLVCDPLYGCITDLGGTTLGATCLAVDSAAKPPALPKWLPSPAFTKILGTRTAAKPSMFGDLGGTWKIEQAGVGSCTIDIHDNVIDANCAGHASTQGSLHVEIDGTKLSGFTSAGIEFSAQRR